MKNIFISALALGVALSAAAEMPRIPVGGKPVFKLSQGSSSTGLKSRSGVKRAKYNISNAPERTVGWGGTLITEAVSYTHLTLPTT